MASVAGLTLEDGEVLLGLYELRREENARRKAGETEWTEDDGESAAQEKDGKLRSDT
jgi:hypothetical protein